jgi:peptidyl-prolyl cis-trans isomerase C
MIATGLISISLIAMNLYAEDSQPAATATPTAAAPAATASVTVATVNGQAITQATLDTVMEMIRSSGQGDKVAAKDILDDLIITELARQEANKSSLADRADIKAKVKDFTDKLVLNAWTQDKAASFKITDADLKAAYDKQIAGDNKYEYKARHILMKTKEEAESVIKELDKGANFADLAKKSSDGPSAATGGDLGWFKPSSMVKPFADAVAKMEPGTISKEPVQTEFGWHVIKLEERRDVKPPAFDTVKPQLQRQLEQEKMLAYMQELRAKADVKVMLPAEQKAEAKSAEPAKTEEKK